MSPAKIFGALLVVALVVGGVTIYMVPGASKPFRSLIAGETARVLTYEVRPASLEIAVEERGSLESSSNSDVYNQVEGATTIIRIIPEGTRVKKGQVICELDSASLRDQLVNQKITTKSAEANFLNAKLTREVAEIAVKEYKEGVYVQELNSYESDIKLAESELLRSSDRLDWARRMFDKGYVSMATKTSEELNYKKAQLTLEQAQQKKSVLVNYTREKTIKELESDVKKASSDELAKQATWELEKGKENKLEKQIGYCTMTAPIDGLIVYANDPSRMFGSNQSQIEEGATVRERQKIISIPDISKMQVNAKVHESQIHQIHPQLKAQIRIDAFADRQLSGTVTDVAPLPDAGNIFSSDIKVYTTRIQIDDPLESLKPGMTAQVKILVDRLDNVLSVPVQAVLQYKGKEHVTKKVGDRFERVEVTLGASNDRHVQILKGLSAGDVVVLNPTSLMSDQEKDEAFRNAKASQKDWGGGAAAKGGPPAKGAIPGKGGPQGKGGAQGKGARRGPAWMQKVPQAERRKLFTGTDDEKREILKKAGLSDAEINQAIEGMKNFGGGGGGFGGGGGGRRGGGGPPGGGDQ